VAANAFFDVEKGNGGEFNTNKKMLITAVGNAKSKWRPKTYTPVWRYPNAVIDATLGVGAKAMRAAQIQTDKARQTAEINHRKAVQRRRNAVRKEAARAARRGVAPRPVRQVPALGPIPAFANIPTSLSSPNASNTEFIAGTAFTPVNANALNRDELIAKIEDNGLIIEAHIPVNITAPRYAQEFNGWTDGTPRFRPVPLNTNAAGVPRYNDVRTSWFEPSSGKLNLFREEVSYHLQDQFQQNIRQSAWGKGKKVTIRENIGDILTSPIPRVLDWIRTELKWTAKWKSKTNGQIEDKLRLQQLPINKILNPGNTSAEFHPSLQAVGGVVMNIGANTHDWQASVDGTRPFFTVTRNTFSSSIFQVCNSAVNRCGAPAINPRRRGVLIRINSDYDLVTPP
jgi:hypothetical protein